MKDTAGRVVGTGRAGALALAVAGGVAMGSGVAAQTVALSDVGLGYGGFATSSNGAGDRVGQSVSWAGDVNADGIDDFIVGAPYADVPATNAGRAYVVFGRSGSKPAYLTAVANGTGGFVINGAALSDRAGLMVRGAGDVNGDGYNDVLVGAPLSSAGGADSGRAWLVWGKNTGTAVNLSALGSAGVALTHDVVGARLGTSLDRAGDVNGDGFSDIIIGAPFLVEPITNANDKVWVIFGGTGLSGTIAMSTVGASVAGFVIQEAVGSERLGDSVAGAGDFNGDGLSDVILGSPVRIVGGLAGAGGAFVVFGKTSQETVPTSDLFAGVGGLAMNWHLQNSMGKQVSSAGDVNGDGLVDVLVASDVADNNNGDVAAGRTLVVFGRTTTTLVNLSGLVAGTGGFVVEGLDPAPGELVENSGASVGPAGDVNGDGFADFIVGAPMAFNNDAGRAYVVFGKTSGTAVSLNTVATGVGGLSIAGQNANDRAGTAVAAVGDVDGDGLSDVVVGAPQFDATLGADAGRVYVVHSPSTPSTSVSAIYRARVAPGNAQRTAVGAGAWGPAGNTFNPARISIDFAQGTGPSGGASQLQVDVLRSDAFTLNLGPPERVADLLFTVTNTNRTSIGTPLWTFRYTDAEVEGLHKPSLKLYRSTAGPGGPWTEMPASNIWWRNEFTASLGTFGQFAIADLGAPTVTITTLDSNPYAGHLPRYGIVFSEPVGDSFTIDDLYIGTSGGFGGFPQLLSVTGTDPNYVVQVMVPAPIVSGTSFTMFLKAGSVTDKAGNELASQVQAPFYVLYPPPAAQGPGDINKDGAVNVADVTALADHIVNGTPLP